MEGERLDTSLHLLLKQELGSDVELVAFQVRKRLPDYRVLHVELRHPSMQVIVKLAGPKAPLACPFDRTAALHRLVAAQTTVPLPEVIAANESYRNGPWRYLITTHLPGHELAAIRDELTPVEQSAAYRLIGDAVAQLHTVRFPAFGELTADAQVHTGQPWEAALRDRASRIIQGPRLRGLFLSVLDRHTDLLTTVTAACLCHEDLHGHNILFENRKGHWCLAAILDFDKAWASHHETDLARMDLWTAMTAPPFWRAYQALLPLDPLYERRRPLYQLLWCLEYARPTAAHLADTQRLCHELGIPAITQFG